MTFSNLQVPQSDLPQISDLNYNGLNRNYLTVELIGLSILWVVLGIAVLINVFFLSANWPVWAPFTLFIAWISFVTLTALLTIKGFNRKKYALREKDIVYNQGLIWRKYAVIPFNRVQHAEVQQGPFERLFNLAKLKVYTAGGSSSDLTIPGLELEKAQSIKQFVLQKTAVDEEE